MSQTPREIVHSCLNFQHPERLPRDLWTLPWAVDQFPEAVAEMERRFPNDFTSAPGVYRPSSRAEGDPYEAGRYVDDWGCVFTSIQGGVIGEIREPIIADIAAWESVQPPYETLPEEEAVARDHVNRFCAGTDLFVKGGCCPRPANHSCRLPRVLPDAVRPGAQQRRATRSSSPPTPGKLASAACTGASWGWKRAFRRSPAVTG